MTIDEAVAEVIAQLGADIRSYDWRMACQHLGDSLCEEFWELKPVGADGEVSTTRMGDYIAACDDVAERLCAGASASTPAEYENLARRLEHGSEGGPGQGEDIMISDIARQIRAIGEGDRE